MSRSALVGIAALAGIFGPTSARSAMDCNALYMGALEKVHKEEIGLEANRIADLHRLALRAYDACSAGDEFNARDFFDQIDKWRR